MGRLQTARLENLIRRWGSIKGSGSVLSESLGDVFPVLDLENLPAEILALGGWYPFWMRGSAVAIAAQLAGVSCINPANSNSLVVVDFINIRVETSSSVTLGSANALFTPFFNALTRDTRLAPTSGVARLGANTNVAAGEDGLQLRMIVNVDREVEFPNGIMTLAPGTQLAVVAGANIDLTVSFAGRHRLAEPSELSF